MTSANSQEFQQQEELAHLSICNDPYCKSTETRSFESYSFCAKIGLEVLKCRRRNTSVGIGFEKVVSFMSIIFGVIRQI